MSFMNPDPKFDQARQEANRELVNILRAQIEARPTERLGQILRNCGFIQAEPVYNLGGSIWKNHFMEEPQAMLARVKETLRNS